MWHFCLFGQQVKAFATWYNNDLDRTKRWCTWLLLLFHISQLSDGLKRFIKSKWMFPLDRNIEIHSWLNFHLLCEQFKAILPHQLVVKLHSRMLVCPLLDNRMRFFHFLRDFNPSVFDENGNSANCCYWFNGTFASLAQNYACQQKFLKYFWLQCHIWIVYLVTHYEIKYNIFLTKKTRLLFFKKYYKNDLYNQYFRIDVFYIIYFVFLCKLFTNKSNCISYINLAILFIKKLYCKTGDSRVFKTVSTLSWLIVVHSDTSEAV